MASFSYKKRQIQYLWLCVLPKICPNIYNTLFLIFIRFCSCTQFDDEILSMNVIEV